MQKLREGDLGLPATDFLLTVQRGRVDGAKIINKFGYNYAVGTGDPQTIWTGNLANEGVYSYALDTPSVIDLISTGNDLVDIMVEGLDEAGEEVSEIITLTGITPSTGTQIFWRVFRAYNIGDTDLLGDISGYVTGLSDQAHKIVFIGQYDQQTLMSVYTIPVGKTGYIFGYDITTGSVKESRVSAHIRKYGKVFRTADLIILFENAISKSVPFQRISERSDIEIRCVTDANNTNISARFKVLLLDNDKFV